MLVLKKQHTKFAGLPHSTYGAIKIWHCPFCSDKEASIYQVPSDLWAWVSPWVNPFVVSHCDTVRCAWPNKIQHDRTNSECSDISPNNHKTLFRPLLKKFSTLRLCLLSCKLDTQSAQLTSAHSNAVMQGMLQEPISRPLRYSTAPPPTCVQVSSSFSAMHVWTELKHTPIHSSSIHS